MARTLGSSLVDSAPSKPSPSELPAYTSDQQDVATETSCIGIRISDFGFPSSDQLFLRSSRENLLLMYYCESFLPANILPKAHANFSKLYVGDVQELRDCMFACSSMQMANEYDTSAAEAFHYYTRAVRGLRRRLTEGGVTGTEDWLLVCTILLHCFEVSRALTSHVLN